MEERRRGRILGGGGLVVFGAGRWAHISSTFSLTSKKDNTKECREARRG